LPQQFEKIDELLAGIRDFVSTGEFTLGAPLREFEERFAKVIGTRHAIGVGSGTDALKLSLKACGVGFGDEVITTANTFIATVGAINELGAKPVFVDCLDTFCMDTSQLEAAITDKTKALLPVHFAGYMSDMRKVMDVAKAHDLPVVEDACQGILASLDGKNAGTWGTAAGFSLHPLKNLNVWGDGGVIATDSDAVNEKLLLLRNHGLKNRDEIELLGYNSRLDTLQAVVGNWIIDDIHDITQRRVENARYYDQHLSDIAGIRIPPRLEDMHCVYHLFMVFADDRDALVEHCQRKGIECKVHYPIPLYQQKGLAHFGYEAGDFPVSDSHARELVSFPCDQHLSREEQNFVITTVKEFYG
jgi:dTDP-4-amino-4,6-dideoxygalactose transaminase